MGSARVYDEADKRRIATLAVRVIEREIRAGTLEGTDSAICAAMPRAVAHATEAVLALNRSWSRDGARA